MEKKHRWRWDLLFLMGCVLIGVLLALYLFLTGKEGAMVQVRVGGEVIAAFPLDTDRTYEIRSENGGTNQLVIQDGEAWVSQASCPDGLCVHMGRIHQKGQSIVCLPNQVVVEILDEEEESDVDFVVG